MELETVPHAVPRSRRRLVVTVFMIAPLVVAVFLPTVLGLERFVVTDSAMDAGRDGSLARGSIALERRVPAGDLRPGDVITFRAPGTPVGGDPVTRRLVTIRDGMATTRGDASTRPDPWALSLDEPTYSKVLFSVPWVGYPFLGGVGAGGWIVLALLALGFLLLAVLMPWRQARMRQFRARHHHSQVGASRPPVEVG